jgi:hypothetical protein
VIPVSNIADVEIERVRARVGSHAITVVSADSRSPPGQTRAKLARRRSSYKLQMNY